MRIIISLIVFFAAAFSYAAAPTFNNLNAAQLESIVEDFGTGFSHTSVTPASSLGTIFGVELGVVAGVVSSDDLSDISQAVGGEDVGAIPHAAIVAGVSLPFGIGAEASFIPELGLSDIDLKRTGLAAKWTLTDGFLPLPISLAAKVHWTNAELSFTQVSPASTVNFETDIIGAQLVASKSFIIIEPYVGIGFVKIDGSLSATASIFDPALTASTSADSDSSGLEYFAGAQLNLLLLRVGVEVGQILGNTKVSGKLSLKF